MHRVFSFAGSAHLVGNTLEFELRPASPVSPAVPPKPTKTKASGAIDDTRPGGVHTLKGKYEKVVSQQLSQTLYTKEFFNGDASGNDSKVKFNDEVKHIPRPEGLSTSRSPSPPMVPVPPPPPPPPPPPNQDRQPPTGADATESVQGFIPPAPPPPPIPKLQEREANEPFTIRGKDGRARVIRVGKIQWPPPPPPDEDEKPRIHVGKLQIDEKKVKDTQPILTKEDAHSRAMAIIRSRSKDSPEEKHEPRKRLSEPVHDKVQTKYKILR